MNKIERIRDGFFKKATGDTGILITSEQNRRYFTEFPSSDGVLAVSAHDAAFFTDSRYIEAAQNAVRGVRVEEQKDTWAQLKAFFEKDGVKKIAPENEMITVAQSGRMKKNLPDFEILGDTALDEAITALRMVKTDIEVENIVKAQRIAEDALRHVLGFIEPGKTEKEIALELDFYMLSHGAEALSFETIAVSGPNTSKPHGVPGDRKVQRGDFITLDFGAVYRGLHSDMTRTFCVGEPTEEMCRVYDIVLQAQLAGINAVREGISASELDGVARKVISDAGYGQYFGHSLGHGVGMDIHEPPFASPVSKEVLSADMVVTVEPGIYIPDRFGVRIEDFVVVREDGCFNMTNAPKELIIL